MDLADDLLTCLSIMRYRLGNYLFRSLLSGYRRATVTASAHSPGLYRLFNHRDGIGTVKRYDQGEKTIDPLPDWGRSLKGLDLPSIRAGGQIGLLIFSEGEILSLTIEGTPVIMGGSRWAVH